MSNLFSYADNQPHSYEEILRASDDVVEVVGNEEESFQVFLAINKNFVIKFKRTPAGYVSIAKYGRLFEDTR